MSRLQDQALALAAIFQTASLVDQVAHTGNISEAQFQPLIDSLFEQNPASTEAVYGQANNLSQGLKMLAGFMQGERHAISPQALRYVMGMMQLQGKLQRRQDLLSVIDNRLQRTQQQMQHFPDSNHPTILASLASIYSDSISTLPLRIQVMGDSQHLKQQVTADKVRVLLFSGIRAAMLWRQLGGRKSHLLFQRKKLAQAAQSWQ